ncbi:cupin domain-containing protein [Billgrantia endophytica]
MVSERAMDTLLQVNLHHIAKGGRSDGQITHMGEEFIYVLKGTIELYLGTESHTLAKGDSAFFKSSEPHGYANVGNTPATILWLNTPPTY